MSASQKMVSLICFVFIFVRLKDYKGGNSWLMLVSWLVNTLITKDFKHKITQSIFFIL